MAGIFPIFKSNPISKTSHRLKASHGSLPLGPRIVELSNVSNNYSYWSSINADIEAHLKNIIPIRPPLSVFEPMQHFIREAPATTAPSLCVAACELVGGCRDQAMAAAAALRLMHAAAYTHKHLLLSDGPGPKTAHSYGPNIELLTPDGIIPFGLELLAGSEDPAQRNSGLIVRVIVEITRAIGSQGVVNGMYNELQYYGQSNGKSSLIDAEWIDLVSKKKEGGLHACAGACGAILGGGSEDEIAKLRKFGLYVGILEGILNGFVRKDWWMEKELQKLRNLALEELTDFCQEKIGDISSLVGFTDENITKNFKRAELLCKIDN